LLILKAEVPASVGNDDDALTGLRSLLMVAAGDPEDGDFEDADDDDVEDDDDGTEDEEASRNQRATR
jgi:hypothetical protein